MCYPVQCPECGKTTWDGCGQHVESVMSSVPPQQQCSCSKGAAGPRTVGPSSGRRGWPGRKLS